MDGIWTQDMDELGQMWKPIWRQSGAFPVACTDVSHSFPDKLCYLGFFLSPCDVKGRQSSSQPCCEQGQNQELQTVQAP